MLERLRPKRGLAIDLVFAAVLTVLYIGFSSKLGRIQSDVNILFLASYLFLFLGVLLLLMISEMNPTLATVIHIGAFPFLSLIFLFAKWLPAVMPKLDGMELSLSLGLLAYVLALIASLFVQFYFRQGVSSRRAGGRSV